MKIFFLTLAFFCLSLVGLKADTTIGNDSQDCFTEQHCTPDVYADEANEDLQINMIASASKHLPQYSVSYITQNLSSFTYWTGTGGKLHGKITFTGLTGEPVTVTALGDWDCRLVFQCIEDIF